MIEFAVWVAAALIVAAACATLLRMWRWVETVLLSPRPRTAARPPARRTVGVPPPPPPRHGSILPPGIDGLTEGARALHRATGMMLAECEERAAAERRDFS